MFVLHFFPDNEDPDSYSRKVGTTAFQNFLKENAKDFISFKADLYATEAAGDPIRKAESIKEIVNSIAWIPRSGQALRIYSGGKHLAEDLRKCAAERTQ